MDRHTLDRAYNNAAAVADSTALTRDWARRSAELKTRAATLLDVPYAQGERCRIDLFSASEDAPLVAFFHGGYWQTRSKDDFAFVAAGPLAHGLSVALVGYTLAPEADMGRIVAECAAALDSLCIHGARRVCVAGWSAGAHLAVTTLGRPGVRGGLAISGIYDLEPIQHSYLNDKLGLDEATALRHSPLRHLSDASAPLIVAFGKDELPELRRQSETFAEERITAGLATELLPLAGANHFSVLELLASPDGDLARALARSVGD